MKRNGEKNQGLTKNVKRKDEEKWRNKNQGLTKNVKRNDEEKWRKKSGFNEECEEK